MLGNIDTELKPQILAPASQEVRTQILTPEVNSQSPAQDVKPQISAQAPILPPFRSFFQNNFQPF